MLADYFKIACRAEYINNACGVFVSPAFQSDFQRSRIRAGGACETSRQIGETCLCCVRSDLELITSRERRCDIQEEGAMRIVYDTEVLRRL
jgi:hypothetical protein